MPFFPTGIVTGGPYVPYVGATANVNLGTFSLTTHAVSADASDGLLLEASNGTDVGILGPANTPNVVWYGAHNFNASTASTIAWFSSSKTLSSLSSVPASLGGTGFTSYAEGDLLYGNGAGTLSKLSAPVVPGYVLGSTAGVPVWEQLSTLTATTITGTANQVLVNGTSGSGQTGPITLTLPQSIGTGSSPTFAGLTVNTSTPLEIVDQSSNVIGLIDSAASDGGLGGVAPQIFLGTNSPSTDNSAILIGRNLSGSRAGGSHGIRDESTYDASGAGLYGYASFDSIPTAAGSANYNHIASFQSRIQYTGSGSLPNIQGLTYQTTHSGSGTVGQSIGFFVDDDLGTGPITSQIGAYFGQLSRGANNFSIYSSGTQQSYHEGLWQVNNAVQTQTAFRAFTTGQTDPGQIVAGTQHRTIGAAATSVIEQWDSFAAASAFIARRTNGTSASPTRLSAGDAIYSILARGRYDGGYSGTSAQLTFEADEDWTASNIIGSRIRFLTAINGGGGVGERVRISGAGNLLVGTTSDVAGPGKIKALGVEDTPIGATTPSTVAATTLQTDAPASSTSRTWKLGDVSSVSPTAQNRTIAVDVNGTTYYLTAKTTND